VCIVVVLGLGYDHDLLWIMRVIITMIVLSDLFLLSWCNGDSVCTVLVLGLSCNDFYLELCSDLDISMSGVCQVLDEL
jgi:hypothetical protein